jgi:RNA polymerase sigma-70 factor (ECF subfamily)
VTKDQQLQIITDKYLSAFLGFAVNKIGNINEAEELAQEIAYQAVLAINKGNIRTNFDHYIWSIAHNTYKRWCGRKKPISLDSAEDSQTFSNILCDDVPIADKIVGEEETHALRTALSRLTSDYRKTIVCFYYDELSIREIGQRLSLSEGMVKFYLRAGKQKLKEAIDVNQIGEKSFSPSEFSIYKSAIDFSKVNVWEVFNRKLPCQIAIICHDSPKSVGDISLETGTPAVYIEDEIKLLSDAGVLINAGKDKYRTNFHILKENTAAMLKAQFTKLYDTYVPTVIGVYDKFLPDLKQCDIFKFCAAPNQWAWYFAANVPDFYYDGYSLTADDYPQILSCGSKAVIFAEAVTGSPWAVGQTPTFLDRCDVHPCDVTVFGPYHRQKELWDKGKAQALYDVYRGDIKECDSEYYAELLLQGYIVKTDGKLQCNVAVTTAKSRSLFQAINAELSATLNRLCVEIRENIARIVRSTIPEQLKNYVKGYTETWISFYAGVYLKEALYNKGFITLPEKDDLTPLACWIYEK